MSNRVFLTLATVMSFSLILGLAVLVIVTRTADELPPPSPTVIIVTNAPRSCAFAWVRRDLPEISSALQSRLPDAVVHVEAYGEDCNNGQSSSFYAMTTDFYFTVMVDSFDENKLADLVQQLYEAALTIPRSDLPAAPGYLNVVFERFSISKRLITRFAEIESALDENKKGANLLNALGGLM